jgi:hypothetical protein
MVDAQKTGDEKSQNSPPVGDARPRLEMGLSDYGDPSAAQGRRTNARWSCNQVRGHRPRIGQTERGRHHIQDIRAITGCSEDDWASPGCRQDE